jgi:uncharacterized protein YndB with AHSA1/START domain
MIEIVRERTLDVPVGRIWELIEPVERLPEWFEGIDTAELLEGMGLGRRQRMRGRWESHRLEIDQTVIDYEPNRVLAWCNDVERLDGKPAPKISDRTESRVELRSNGSATLIVLISRLKPGNAFKGALLRLVAVPRITRMMEVSLGRIEKILQKIE